LPTQDNPTMTLERKLNSNSGFVAQDQELRSYETVRGFI